MEILEVDRMIIKKKGLRHRIVINSKNVHDISVVTIYTYSSTTIVKLELRYWENRNNFEFDLNIQIVFLVQVAWPCLRTNTLLHDLISELVQLLEEIQRRTHGGLRILNINQFDIDKRNRIYQQDHKLLSLRYKKKGIRHTLMSLILFLPLCFYISVLSVNQQSLWEKQLTTLLHSMPS